MPVPSRDPTYFRWAEDKPVTTNQTYGFELRNTAGGTGSGSGQGQMKGVACSKRSGCNDSAACCNGTYSDSDYRFHHHACVECPDCVELSTRSSRKQKCGSEPVLCPRHRRRVKTITPSINRFSPEPAVKPINEGYVTGRVPVTKKIASVKEGANGQRAQNGGVSSSADGGQNTGSEKDLYLWHAMSGSLVHCKNFAPESEPF